MLATEPRSRCWSSFRSSQRASDPLEMAFAAHGIKNSLSGVAGFAQLLDSDLEPGDPRRRWTQRIRTGIEEAHERLADLSQAPRPSSGAGRDVQTELASAANCVLERCSGMLQKHAIRCVNSIPTDLRVRMDRAALDAVLHDLVQNAIEAMQARGGELVLDASPNPPRLWVRDSGPGVAAALRPSIFEAGVSQKGSGRGLGLCRVRALVTAHGGTIRVTSAAQGGAEFELGFAADSPASRR
jgi:signal transduction histidine kinase